MKVKDLISQLEEFDPEAHVGQVTEPSGEIRYPLIYFFEDDYEPNQILISIC